MALRTLRRSPLSRGRFSAAAAGTLLAIVGLAGTARATHFRYGHVTWAPRPSPARTVDFTIQGVWRRDAYGNAGTGAANRCVSATAPPVNSTCTGAGGFAGVGDIIHETQGETTFDFGDGTTTFGSTISGRKALLYLVTSVDPTNNWLFGLVVDQRSLPTIDTTVEHTYAGAATSITAKIEDCCRISPCQNPNAHLNNPDNGYRVTTTVDFTAGPPNSSPVSSVPPIVLCPQNGPCNFQVPVSDNEGHAVTYRLATATEMRADYTEGGSAGLGQPGQGMATCADATIGSGTGTYAWNTSMCRLAGSPGPNPPAGGCNNANLHSLYSTQVIVEETAPQVARSAVDFLIELVPACNLNTHAPTFQAPTPPCGSALSVNPGQLLTFSISADDVDANDSVTLNAVGLPGGAAMVPGLPTSGNPVSSTFSWTPTAANVGQHLVTFTAVDTCSGQALCAITIDVSQENCTDGVDNDGDGQADCADLDCDGTPCEDGAFCTENDSCQNGTCTAGTARDCSDTSTCTNDSCNEAGNQCIHPPVANDTPCDDGAFCTDADTCQGGTCVPGPARDCADPSACTADSCNEGGDVCDHTPLSDNAPCDDGSFCSVGDTCQSGSCAGTARDCADTSACTADSCSEPTDQCVHDPAPLQGSTCDDGQYCTVDDACTNGACSGASRDCADTSVCTADSCDESEDQCVNDPVPLQGTTCDDAQYCTVNDVCSGGACAGPARDCADTSVCTLDSCNEAADQCVHDAVPLQGNSCDDGQFCTTGDACANGACSGAPRNCTDSDGCSADTCDDVGDQCLHTPIGEGGACEDGFFCTVNETCTSGSCGGSIPRECADTSVCTVDSCDDTADQCIHNPAPLEGTTCNDGNACTSGDHCAGGACAATPLDCSDGQPCTVDTCSPLNGCAHSDGPATGCLIPERSVFVIRKGATTAKNKLVWRWIRGPADITSFGDPTQATEFALCVYDQSNGGSVARLAASTVVPPGAVWRRLGGGTALTFKRKQRDATGQLKVLLKSLASGKGRVMFKAKGDRTPAAPPVGATLFDDDNSVLVQLVSSEGKCWAARYTAPGVTHRAASFKDKCGGTKWGSCQ